jgi:hypothetical protein
LVKITSGGGKLFQDEGARFEAEFRFSLLGLLRRFWPNIGTRQLATWFLPNPARPLVAQDYQKPANP